MSERFARVSDLVDGRMDNAQPAPPPRCEVCDEPLTKNQSCKCSQRVDHMGPVKEEGQP